ncbi:MAG: response regulator transcription factor [Xanthomonadales bacterium]|jgi:DNA-binding NarL/FixJ family response regulator|nr:response regulator transcription factor [Xanthomonadales bacterium]
MNIAGRILIVDDLASSRDWLAKAVALAFPASTVSVAGSLTQARALLSTVPSLALIDLGLPDGSGVELIEALNPLGCLCVVATVFDDDAHLFPALRAGAQGYVLKDQSTQELAELLTGIASGQPPLSPSIARRLLRHFHPEPAQEATLTARESEVLVLIAKGLSVVEVAGMLNLSRHTVAGYLKDIYRKLAVSTRAEATLEALRRGLVSP